MVQPLTAKAIVENLGNNAGDAVVVDEVAMGVVAGTTRDVAIGHNTGAIDPPILKETRRT